MGTLEVYQYKGGRVTNAILIIQFIAIRFDSCLWNITPTNIITTDVTTLTEAPVELSKPLTDKTVTEKDTISLSCQLSKAGQTVIWLKDGVELSLEDTRYVIENHEFSYMLTVHDCELANAGEYTLQCGDISTTAKVAVEG